jgi:hypothetical protein
MASLDGNSNERLDALFQLYAQACGSPEPDALFMPRLWQKIESRQKTVVLFRRMASGLVTAAALACLVMAYLVAPGVNGTGFYQATYLEVLAEDHASQSPDYAEPVSVETDSETELKNELL